MQLKKLDSYLLLRKIVEKLYKIVLFKGYYTDNLLYKIYKLINQKEL